jgi:hypothetical protein
MFLFLSQCSVINVFVSFNFLGGSDTSTFCSDIYFSLSSPYVVFLYLRQSTTESLWIWTICVCKEAEIHLTYVGNDYSNRCVSVYENDFQSLLVVAEIFVLSEAYSVLNLFKSPSKIVDQNGKMGKAFLHK